MESVAAGARAARRAHTLEGCWITLIAPCASFVRDFPHVISNNAAGSGGTLAAWLARRRNEEEDHEKEDTPGYTPFADFLEGLRSSSASSGCSVRSGDGVASDPDGGTTDAGTTRGSRTGATYGSPRPRSEGRVLRFQATPRQRTTPTSSAFSDEADGDGAGRCLHSVDRREQRDGLPEHGRVPRPGGPNRRRPVPRDLCPAWPHAADPNGHDDTWATYVNRGASAGVRFDFLIAGNGAVDLDDRPRRRFTPWRRRRSI